jgi:hypothetical protein
MDSQTATAESDELINTFEQIQNEGIQPEDALSSIAKQAYQEYTVEQNTLVP